MSLRCRRDSRPGLRWASPVVQVRCRRRAPAPPPHRRCLCRRQRGRRGGTPPRLRRHDPRTHGAVERVEGGLPLPHQRAVGRAGERLPASRHPLPHHRRRELLQPPRGPRRARLPAGRIRRRSRRRGDAPLRGPAAASADRAEDLRADRRQRRPQLPDPRTARGRTLSSLPRRQPAAARRTGFSGPRRGEAHAARRTGRRER